jgi:hypothetical protein
MSIEQLFLIEIHKKGMRQMYEDAFVNPEPEKPGIPLKPGQSLKALLCWWFGSQLVKTGRRLLQFAG